MRYKNKPVVIEAFQYDGSLEFVEGGFNKYYVPKWAEEAYINGTLHFDNVGLCLPELFIKTLEGHKRVCIDDYIIQGMQGELYPCKKDIFEQTYEVAE